VCPLIFQQRCCPLPILFSFLPHVFCYNSLPPFLLYSCYSIAYVFLPCLAVPQNINFLSRPAVTQRITFLSCLAVPQHIYFCLCLAVSQRNTFLSYLAVPQRITFLPRLAVPQCITFPSSLAVPQRIAVLPCCPTAYYFSYSSHLVLTSHFVPNLNTFHICPILSQFPIFCTNFNYFPSLSPTLCTSPSIVPYRNMLFHQFF